MRRPIEAIADDILAGGFLQKGEMTLGELAKHFNETPERIADALDVTKIKRGIPSYIAVPKGEDE